MQRSMANRDYEKEQQLKRDREIGWEVRCDGQECGRKIEAPEDFAVIDGDVLCWLCQSS